MNIDWGVISNECHYGTASLQWWFSVDGFELYPIRLNYSTHFKINDITIRLRILENSLTGAPIFRASYDGILYDSADMSNAVTSLYVKVTGKKNTKISGSLAFGLNNPKNISDKLLEGISFIPFETTISENMKLLILTISIDENETIIDYLSILHGKNVKTPVIQKICGKEYRIQSLNNSKSSISISADEVWETFGLLKKYKGKFLFGFENEFVKASLKNLTKTTASIIYKGHWTFLELKKKKTRYLYHCTSLQNWYQVFNNLLNRENTIFELYEELSIVYNSDSIDSRNIRGWRAMLRVCGCVCLDDNNGQKPEFWSNAENPSSDIQTHKLYFQNLKCIISGLKREEFFYLFSNESKDFEVGKKIKDSFQKSLLKNPNGSEGKLRIASILADEFTYNELSSEFGFSNNFINNSRIHARINGPGCPRLQKPNIVKRRVTDQILERLNNFLDCQERTTRSSYRVDKKGQPIRYLENTKTELWKEYMEETDIGVGRSFFFAHMGKKYEYRKDMGGLCPTCNEYGHEILNELVANELFPKTYKQRLLDARNIIKLKLKTCLKNSMDTLGHPIHSDIRQHCLKLAFGNCKEEHFESCTDCNKIFTVLNDIEGTTPKLSAKINLAKRKFFYFLTHCVRKYYLDKQFEIKKNSIVNTNNALIIQDYKMKILPHSAREVKDQWFGKKGWTLLTMLVITWNFEKASLQVSEYI